MIQQNSASHCARSIIAVAIMMLSLQAIGSGSFSYMHQGKRLYYSVTSANTVEVTYRVDYHVTGDVIIPDIVVANGITYTVTGIGRDAFAGCQNMTSIIIPNTITEIGDGAFQACYSLTSVVIPNSVITIKSGAFAGCRLASITIGNGVISIGTGAFTNCRFTSITIPNSVTEIGLGAFSGCSNLTSVTLSNSITIIEKGLFSGCRSLTSVNIPNSVTAIESMAFKGCNSLTSIELPIGLTSIGDSAFLSCSRLSSITIPDSVGSIGKGVFNGCSNLTTLNFNAINCQDLSIGTFGTSLSTINIGNGVTYIPANFAKNYNRLQSVVIRNNVTSIGNNAFAGCNGLTSITIPKNIVFIGENAFGSCSNLTVLEFNAMNCQDFNHGEVFGNRLTVINIGNKVKRIPAFFAENCRELSSITFSDSVTVIGNSAFRNCIGLTSLAMNNIEIINDYAFEGCTSLVSFTIPNAVTYIGKGAFKNCSGLNFVSIGDRVYSIEDEAFYGCSNLLSIVSYATIPPTINGRNTFLCPVSCTVTVPCGSLLAYLTSSWEDFFNEHIQEDCATSLQEVNVREFAMYPNPAKSFVTLECEALEENTLSQILDINGRRVRTLDLKAGVETLRIDVSDLPKGVYTIMLGNVTKKLIVE